MSPSEGAATVAAARAGDEAAFAELVEPYRRELQVHCYRMLGSLEDAEDLVQETFLRAWRSRRTFEGRASFRAWLYRIATNACLDALERRPRVAEVHEGAQPPAEVPWLQPYPDQLLEEVAGGAAEPAEELVAKETIELAFIAAIQLLPPRQRAVLISRDVLGWSAAETAALLDISVAAVNSALQRARATLKEHLPRHRLDWAPDSDPTQEERALLQRYMEASEDGDPAAMVELLREDAFFAMPPEREWVVGAERIVEAWVQGGFGDESWGHLRCVLTSANAQPAVAFYVKRAGDTEYRPLALDVLRIEGGAVAEVIAFPLEPLLEPLGLPPTL
ncbi:MAG TPA: RNA polymerase subunit sigma-70 [Gaiellaceae bacterium]|nr:RNA polymerase subunit sigma-70 [Gaiellaceae bacterium]